MSTDWIHFIGRTYYTEARFKREAREHGVTRRVARRTLESMEYGDVVWLAINDGKSSMQFGKFILSTIAGFSAEESALLDEAFTLELVSSGGVMVSRGCGSYIAGPTYAIKGEHTAGDILAAIEPATQQGKLMAGGEFIETLRVRLADMRFNQGFRPFDADAFLAAVAKADPRKPRVRGHFYSKRGARSNVVRLDEHRAQMVVDYRAK